jgi:hypothetical protein
MISTASGIQYKEILYSLVPSSGDRMDLVAYFLRRADKLLRQQGTFGLITTNSVSQGDTRTGGLAVLCDFGFCIFAATRRLRWPGDANVVVSVVHAAKAIEPTIKELDGRPVANISAYLFASDINATPNPIAANAAKSFEGVKPYGQGFIFDDEDPKSTPHAVLEAILKRHPECASCVFPYISGEEVNDSPRQLHTRAIINFGQLTLDECKAYDPLLDIVRVKVKPERDGKSKEVRDRPWWQLFRPRTEMLTRTSAMERFLVVSRVGDRLGFVFLKSGVVPSEALVVLAFDTAAAFSVMQSRAHEIWTRFLASSMKDDLRYTPSDCFETFPFPENFETHSRLEAVGKEYYESRAALMVKNCEGLTKTYNRFHDPSEASPEIARLRNLHAAMDRAVLDAYEWQDVQPTCGFALDWLDLDDDELADTLASAPDDIRERIESADYFFPDAASACRFQSHIKKDGKGKLPWRYRWPDDTRDDILARLLALNAKRAELERLTGLSGAKSKAKGDAASGDTDSDSDAPSGGARPAKKAKKASKRAAKKAAPRPMLDEDST